MAKTKTKAVRGIDVVRAERDEVEAQIRAWEAEESSLKSQGELDWEGANDPGRLEQAIEAERRLAQIPTQLRAGKIRSTELEIELLELQQAAVQERITELHGEMVEANERLEEAQRVAAAARGAWSEARYEASDLRREAMRLRDKVLYELKQEPAREAAKGPLVRSQWQAWQGDDSPEGAFSDARPSFSPAEPASPANTAVSADEATVVVPSQALEQHRKGGGGG